MVQKLKPPKFYARHPKYAVFHQVLTQLLNNRRVVILADDGTAYRHLLDMLSDRGGSRCFDAAEKLFTHGHEPTIEGYSLYYLAPQRYPMSQTYDQVRQHVFDRQFTPGWPKRLRERVGVVELHTHEATARFAANYWQCELLDARYGAEAYRHYFQQLDARLRANFDLLPRAFTVNNKDKRAWIKATPLLSLPQGYLRIDWEQMEDHMTHDSPPMWSVKARNQCQTFCRKLEDLMRVRRRTLPALKKLLPDYAALHIPYKGEPPSETLELMAAGIQRTDRYGFREGFDMYEPGLARKVLGYIARQQRQQAEHRARMAAMDAQRRQPASADAQPVH